MLTNLTESLSKFFESDSFPIISEYAKILIPCFLTYVGTRFAFQNSRKYDILEKQFHQVYLPLFLLTQQYLNNDSTTEDLNAFTRKAEKLFYQNFQFVYPKTIKSFSKVKAASSPTEYGVRYFTYQVESDYDKLRIKLGYPADSLLDFFKRLNLIDKMIYTVIIIFLLSSLFTFLNVIIAFFNGELSRLISNIFYFGFSFFMFYIFSYMAKQ